jgi:MTH538 TIR-like domain (DUF1863)
MANTRAFVSFDADNNSVQKLLFCGQTRLSSVPFDVQDWSSKETLPQRTWEQTIQDKISRCHTLIVLVGKKTSSAGGVIKEIAMAHKLNVPVFGVYVDGANILTPLPAGLQRGRTIAWTWPGIAGAVKQIMSEGKNKQNR